VGVIVGEGVFFAGSNVAVYCIGAMASSTIFCEAAVVSASFVLEGEDESELKSKETQQQTERKAGILPTIILVFRGRDSNFFINIRSISGVTEPNERLYIVISAFPQVWP
jgi:hypothetical protein